MNFALLACPHSPEQIKAIHPVLSWLPGDWLPGMTKFFGVSPGGVVEFPGLSGCILDFPLMPGQTGQAEKKVAQAAKYIRDTGAKVVGLEAGLRNLAPVFAGHGLAVSSGAVTHVAASLSLLLGFFAPWTGEINVLILNPVNAIGLACARLLAVKVRHLTLMGNFLAPLQRIARRLVLETGTAPVIARMDSGLFSRADLIIDLAGIDLNVYCPAPKAVVWQPGMETEYLGPARLINEAIISLNSSCRIEGDLPTGLLRATTSEAIIQGMGVERIWPRTFGEVTADQVQRICQLANDSGMAIAGYINRRYLSLIKNQIEFDK